MKKINSLIAILFTLVLVSCSTEPEPIVLGKDACSFCKMGIADKNFGAEIMTNKGKVFKFDDMHCVIGFLKANTINNNDIKETYLVNYNEPHDFLIASKAFLLKSEDLKSPMGGNVAAFSTDKELQEALQKMPGEAVTWASLTSGD